MYIWSNDGDCVVEVSSRHNLVKVKLVLTEKLDIRCLQVDEKTNPLTHQTFLTGKPEKRIGCLNFPVLLETHRS